jgi:hypothetical protein
VDIIACASDILDVVQYGHDSAVLYCILLLYLGTGWVGLAFRKSWVKYPTIPDVDAERRVPAATEICDNLTFPPCSQPHRASPRN